MPGRLWPTTYWTSSDNGTRRTRFARQRGDKPGDQGGTKLDFGPTRMRGSDSSRSDRCFRHRCPTKAVGRTDAARQAFLPDPPPATWTAGENLMERLGPHFDVNVWISASSNVAGRRHADRPFSRHLDLNVAVF